tara:strand:+ start:552 stop:803 length:252 start_codon:yes stop_codon:yes gene_type:complete
MVGYSFRVAKLMEILEDFVIECPQANLAAADTRREIAERAVHEWTTWRIDIGERTRKYMAECEAEWQAKQPPVIEGDEIYVER